MVTNHWARFCEPGPWGLVEVEERSSAVGESRGSAGHSHGRSIGQQSTP